MNDPAVLTDQRALRDTGRRLKELEPIVAAYQAYKSAMDDVGAAREMLEEAIGEERDEMRAEIDDAEATIARLDEELKVLLLPRDPNDEKNVIVEIRGAEGGEEANLFARDLYEMYARYADRNGWKVDVLGADESDRGGRRHAGREEPDPEPGQGHAGAAGPAAQGGAGPAGGRAVGPAPQPGRRWRAIGEDPDVQLQGEPGHRPPNQ